MSATQNQRRLSTWCTSPFWTQRDVSTLLHVKSFLIKKSLPDKAMHEGLPCCNFSLPLPPHHLPIKLFPSTLSSTCSQSNYLSQTTSYGKIKWFRYYPIKIPFVVSMARPQPIVQHEKKWFDNPAFASWLATDQHTIIIQHVYPKKTLLWLIDCWLNHGEIDFGLF